MTKTHRGSCHCGAVRFEADIDLSKGTSKCNCSICWKTRTWNHLLRPEQFRLLSGQDDLAEYRFGTKTGRHRFCKHCGVRPFGEGYVEQLGGAFVSINLACLDDLDPAELLEAPLTLCDGRNDKWWETPAETRHL